MSDYSRSNPAELLCQAHENGDLNGLLELYRSYVRLLARAQVGQRLAGKFDASDIVQEVFLQASRGFLQFRGTSEPEFLAWLRQILATVLANHVRKYQGTKRRDVRLERNLQQQLVDASSFIHTALIDESPSPSERLAQKECGVLLAEALEQLPADYHEVVVLHYIERLTFPEISERMGRTVPSLRRVQTVYFPLRPLRARGAFDDVCIRSM